MTNQGGGEADLDQPSARNWPVQPASLFFLVLGLALTGVLTAWSQLSYLHSEQRLTKLDLRLAGSSISKSSDDVELRLSEALTAVASSNRPSYAMEVLRQSLGRSGPFIGAEIFRDSRGRLSRELALGATPLYGESAARTLSLEAVGSKTLLVRRPISGRVQRFAYAFALRGPDGLYVAYAEQALPLGRHVPVAKGTPTSGLYYAIYYGEDQDPRDLVVTDAPSLPLGGTTAATTIAYGSARLRLVASPISSLAGAFSEYVPWGILGAGIVLSLAGLLLVEWLVRRRVVAESLARENRRLYEAQRGVAETLQRSLLPAVLPSPPGMAVAARYLPGTAGIELGGDWYDLVEVDPRQLFFTVGDVSGRGLDAAVMMTTLRTAIWAYATDGDEPAEVLEKLGRLVQVETDGRFATVLCGVLDIETGDGIVSSAGHPPPLVLGAAGCSVLEIRQGPPIGIGDRYEATLFSLRPGETLLGYTDGLIERRDEPVTEGIRRLVEVADAGLAPDQLVEEVVRQLVPSAPVDDIAILALRRNARIESERPAQVGRPAGGEGGI